MEACTSFEVFTVSLRSFDGLLPGAKVPRIIQVADLLRAPSAPDAVPLAVGGREGALSDAELAAPASGWPRSPGRGARPLGVSVVYDAGLPAAMTGPGALAE